MNELICIIGIIVICHIVGFVVFMYFYTINKSYEWLDFIKKAMILERRYLELEHDLSKLESEINDDEPREIYSETQRVRPYDDNT